MERSRTLHGLLFLLYCVSASTLRADPVDDFVFTQLQPLLRNRQYELQVRRDSSTASITVISGKLTRMLGRYSILLDPALNAVPIEPVPLQTSLAKYGGMNVVQIRGQLRLPMAPIDVQAQLRSLFRADPLLHPMLSPTEQVLSLAPMQEELLQQLRQFREAARARDEGMKALIISPPGSGKTVVLGSFLKELVEESPQRPYKVFFVVQNKEILDRAATKLQSMLGLSTGDVRRVYGQSASPDFFNETVKLTAISRTTMHRYLSSFSSARANFNGRVFFVTDEAHHLGKVEGEFDEILATVNANLGRDDALIGCTATPWHTDSDLIERIFANHVVTTLLTAQEREQLLSERKLIQMSRLMLFRAMAQGYLSPIQRYRQIRYLNDGARPILARNFLDDWQNRFSELGNNADRYAMMRREVTIHFPFIRTVLKDILSTVRTDAKGENLYWNRGIIFVPSIAHADVYAFLLNRLSYDPKQRIVARPYHSGLSPHMRDETMDWFRDQEARDSRAGDRHRQVHKYLVAIRTIGEGFDEPATNHIILAKPYSDEDAVGMRELLQNLGRASRLAYAKPFFLISDFTGDMQRLIFDGLDQSLINSFFVPGGERDLTPVPRTPTVVNIDSARLSPGNFATEEVTIPHAQLTTFPARSEGLLPDQPLTWQEVFRWPGSATFLVKAMHGSPRLVGVIRAFDGSIESLLKTSSATLMAQPNFGRLTFKELTSILEKLGLELSQRSENNPVIGNMLNSPSPYSATSIRRILGSADEASDNINGAPDFESAWKATRIGYEPYSRLQSAELTTPLTWGEFFRLKISTTLFLSAVQANSQLQKANEKANFSLHDLLASDQTQFKNLREMRELIAHHLLLQKDLQSSTHSVLRAIAQVQSPFVLADFIFVPVRTFHPWREGDSLANISNVPLGRALRVWPQDATTLLSSLEKSLGITVPQSPMDIQALQTFYHTRTLPDFVNEFRATLTRLSRNMSEEDQACNDLLMPKG